MLDGLHLTYELVSFTEGGQWKVIRGDFEELWNYPHYYHVNTAFMVSGGTALLAWIRKLYETCKNMDGRNAEHMAPSILGLRCHGQSFSVNNWVTQWKLSSICVVGRTLDGIKWWKTLSNFCIQCCTFQSYWRLLNEGWVWVFTESFSFKIDAYQSQIQVINKTYNQYQSVKNKTGQPNEGGACLYRFYSFHLNL